MPIQAILDTLAQKSQNKLLHFLSTTIEGQHHQQSLSLSGQTNLTISTH